MKTSNILITLKIACILSFSFLSCSQESKPVEVNPGAKVNTFEELTYRIKKQGKIVKTNIIHGRPFGIKGKRTGPEKALTPITPREK